MKTQDIEAMAEFKQDFLRDAREQGFTKEQATFLSSFFEMYMEGSLILAERINEVEDEVTDLQIDICECD